jgi:hypothetical protein
MPVTRRCRIESTQQTGAQTFRVAYKLPDSVRPRCFHERLGNIWVTLGLHL